MWTSFAGSVPDLALAAQSLGEFVAEDLARGSLIYFEPYETVHRRNVSLLTGSRQPPGGL